MLLCYLYITSFLGNGIILFVILTKSILHEPMYYFLSMVSATDLGLCISTLVTLLGIFWFNARKNSVHACAAQTFFMQLFTVMESSVPLAMAFDCFIAPCNPLRCATIFTDSRIIKMWFAILIKGIAILVSLALLLKHLSLCQSCALHHSYCIHLNIIQLSCADNWINSFRTYFPDN